MESRLRIVSYNIRYDSTEDGKHSWTNRRAKVTDLLLFHRPDLIGLQEALLSQIKDCVGAITGYDWVGEGREGGRRGEFTPILYRNDRFRLVSHKTRWLSQEPDTPGTIGWDAQLPRTVTSAVLGSLNSDRLLLVHNTHFDHKGREAVRHSVELLCRWMVEDAGKALARTLLLGDLNFAPDSKEYWVLSNVVSDTRTSAEELVYGPESTYIGGGFRVGSDPGLRCDYIFVSPDIRVLRQAHVSDSWYGTHPSDHFPVLSDVEVKEFDTA
jgi:endonuclease/exonuclease/phosphatase family metal-dependent hydrolase